MPDQAGSVKISAEEATNIPPSIAPRVQTVNLVGQYSLTSVTAGNQTIHIDTENDLDLTDAPFGTHLREAREIIKDWWQNR